MNLKELSVCAALVALLLTGIFAACSTDEVGDNWNEKVIAVTAEAGLKGGQVQTRLGYEDDTSATETNGMKLTWSYSATDTENDKFGVFQGSESTTPKEFKLKAAPTAGEKNGIFTGSLEAVTLGEGKTQTLYALYPYSAVSGNTSGNPSSITLNVADQTQAANVTTTHLSAKDFMRASADWNGTTGNVEFGTFTHLMAVLRLDIELPATTTNNIASIVLAGMNATQTLDLTKDPAKDKGVWSAEKSSDITLTTTNGTPDGNKKYTAYLMVFPTTALKALTITVNLADSANTSYTKNFTSNTDIALNAGNRYWITIKDLDKVGGGSDSEDIGGGGGTGGGTGEGDTGSVPFD